MVSSEQCKWCDRDIALSTNNSEFLAFWFHPHTGSVLCRASDLLEVNTMVAGGPFRATPEDAE